MGCNHKSLCPLRDLPWAEDWGSFAHTSEGILIPRSVLAAQPWLGGRVVSVSVGS